MGALVILGVIVTLVAIVVALAIEPVKTVKKIGYMPFYNSLPVPDPGFGEYGVITEWIGNIEVYRFNSGHIHAYVWDMETTTILAQVQFNNSGVLTYVFIPKKAHVTYKKYNGTTEVNPVGDVYAKFHGCIKNYFLEKGLEYAHQVMDIL